MKQVYVLLILFPLVLAAQEPLQSIPDPYVQGSGGCWDFDGNTFDHSGNNNHGNAANIVYVPNRFNQPNTAAYFNGVNSKVVVPHSATINFTTGVNFSFTYWQKSYAGNVDAVIITKHTYGNWDGYNFIANNQSNSGYCNGSNHMYWYVAAGAQEDACSNGPVLSDSVWHFIAGTYDAANNLSYLYIDGVQQTDVGQASGVSSTPANLVFGFDEDLNSLFFHGVIDDACLYPRLLSSTEIQNMYNGTISGIVSNAGQQITSIQPNPSAGNFLLKLPAGSRFEKCEIRNQVGQCLQSSEINLPETILWTDLPAGVYFITLSGANGISATEKLIIAR